MTSLSMDGRRPPVTLAWLLVATLLGGCGMQRLAYNNADWFVLQKLDSYLDLTDVQESRAEEALAAAHARHRRGVLPGFAAAFADAATRVRRGVNEDDVRGFMDTARTLLAATLEQALPPVSHALAGLSDEQRIHLARRLHERNEEYAERHWLGLPAAERLERRAARTVSRIEDWTGALNAEQIALVGTLRSEMPDNASDWLAHTRSQQQKLLSLLARETTVDDLNAFLRDWWLFREALPDNLARARERQTDGFVKLIARLASTLDSVQRIHLANRLDDLARDARELAVET